MPLVDAKCTNCGATLRVDNSKEALICQYCNSAFIVEKAINQFNISNAIYANVVNVYQNNPTNKDGFIVLAGVLKKYNGTQTNAVIPDSVITIDEKAFENCSGLTSVVIPNTVLTIKSEAFANCVGLKKIEIPSSVRNIEKNVFSGCTSLEKVVFHRGITTIPSQIFSGCVKLNSISIPDTVTDILEKAFHGCSALEHIDLPPSIKTIGTKAFHGCIKMKKLVLPDSLHKITRASLPQNIVTLVVPENTVWVEEYAFSGCKKLKEVIASPSFIENALSKDESFMVTPWAQERIKENCIKQNLCTYCGGEFKGLFSKVCKVCGMPKNY